MSVMPEQATQLGTQSRHEGKQQKMCLPFLSFDRVNCLLESSKKYKYVKFLSDPIRGDRTVRSAQPSFQLIHLSCAPKVGMKTLEDACSLIAKWDGFVSDDPDITHPIH